MIVSNQKNQSIFRQIRSKKYWNNIDIIIWVVPLILVHLSCLLIASTQRNLGIADWYQHAFMAYLGCLIAFFLAQVPLSRLRTLLIPLYIITIIMLLSVQLIGTEALGAQRWLSFAGFNFQPSEFAKITSILIIASILERQKYSSLSKLVKSLLVVFPIWLLVFLQPDLGTSLVFGSILIGMLYWAGIPFEWLFIVLSSFITGLIAFLYKFGLIIWMPFIAILSYKSLPNKKNLTVLTILFHLFIAKLTPWFWKDLLKEYQRDRLTLFLDPSQDPLGGGYHLIQSKIGIGSGGLSGTGILQGQLTKLKFIPEQHTDFIFSALGEETGFLGTFLVVLLFFILICRLIKIAIDARTDFESLVVIGIATMILFQVIVNIFMTIGLGPVTGIPLPFMSYGRTALLANFTCLGLCLSISRRGQSIRKNM